MSFRRVYRRKLHDRCLSSNRKSQMKVEIVAREMVKPSSPTPNCLRNFNLSLLDQLAPTIFGPVVFFYSFNRNRTDNRYTAERTGKLKKSLSDTLNRYYPFAGRLRRNSFVSCDDSGADLLEAEVNAPLSSVLDEPYLEGIQRLIPTRVDSPEARTKLLLAQASFFSCGGMALGICLSHKVADATSIGIFMKGWAAMSAFGSDTMVGSPVFNGASIFPPRDFSNNTPAPVVEPEITKSTVSKRFVFDASSLRDLRRKSSSSDVNHPTRVEAVTALIWKCAMKASSAVSGTPKPSVLAHSANIRKRVSPTLPENSIGNFSSYFAARWDGNNQTKLQTLVSEIRKSKQKFDDGHVKKLIGNEKSSEIICQYQREAGEILASRNCDFYIFSSLCRSGFYEPNFGCGTPTWVSVSCVQQKNIVSLMDSKEGDGIEAWVTLNEQDMKIFEQDRELLAFASLNPRVIEPSV